MYVTSFRRGIRFVLVWIAFAVGTLHADENATSDPTPQLTRAEELFVAGKFGDASESYRAVLSAQPNLVSAQAGLVRSLLHQQKVDEAFDLVNKYLIDQPDSAPLLAAQGDVLFRRGEISSAETSYLASISIDPNQFYAHLGLSRVYDASFLNAKSYEELRLAHKIAPDNVEVRLAWLRILPAKDRLIELEHYLLGPHPDDARVNTSLWDGLIFLRANADKPPHLCKRVGKATNTEVGLEMTYHPGQPMRGIGMMVKIQGRRIKMLLDTGGNGITLSRKAAESMGLTRISEQHLAGLGDEGLQPASMVVADYIQVGDLKFQDCYITLVDKDHLVDDGVFGTNFFGGYLIDIDIPAMRLKLSHLPQRPDDIWDVAWLTNPFSLQQSDHVAIPMLADDSRTLASSQNRSFGYRDRYIAPEMADWTQLFHAGNILLVPTRLNGSHELLFALDTGAATGVMSLRLAPPPGDSKPSRPTHLRGLNGASSAVYPIEASLDFGSLPPWTGKLGAVDLRNITPPLGPEISGFLGFPILRSLEIKLDYRDGLVQFTYDPDRTHSFPFHATSPEPHTSDSPNSRTSTNHGEADPSGVHP